MVSNGRIEEGRLVGDDDQVVLAKAEYDDMCERLHRLDLLENRNAVIANLVTEGRGSEQH